MQIIFVKVSQGKIGKADCAAIDSFHSLTLSNLRNFLDLVSLDGVLL